MFLVILTFLPNIINKSIDFKAKNFQILTVRVGFYHKININSKII